MYEVAIGCAEWDEEETFETLEEAEKYIASWREKGFNYGSYAASYGWIENTETGEKTIFWDVPENDEDHFDDDEEDIEEDAG